MAINAGDVVWNIGADTKGLDKALGEASKQAQGLGEKFAKHSRAIGVGMTAAGAAITAGFGASIKTFAEAGDQIQKMSARTGFATETLSELKFAAERSGASLESVEKATKKMSTVIFEAGDEAKKSGQKQEEAAAKAAAAVEKQQKKLAELEKQRAGAKSEKELESVNNKIIDQREKLTELLGKQAEVTKSAGQATGTYTEALQSIGLAHEQLASLNPEQQFLTIAMALADVADQSTKTALAQELFGRAGTDLLPMLAEGSAGLQELRDRANELGVVFDQEAANKAAAFQDAMLDLKESTRALMFTLADVALPAIQSFVEKATETAIKIREWADAHPVLAENILKVVGVAGVLMTAFGPLLIMLPGIATAISGVVSVLGGLSTAFGVTAGAAGFMSGGAGLAGVVAAILGSGGLVVAVGVAVAALAILKKGADNVRAAKEQLKESEERLAGGIEHAIQKLEAAGGSIDRNKMKNKDLDEQLQLVRDAWDRLGESTKHLRTEQDTTTESTKGVTTAQGDAKGAFDKTRIAADLQKDAFRRNSQTNRETIQQYWDIQQAANAAAAAIENAANAAGGGQVAAATGGVVPGMATGGTVKGYASGGAIPHRIVEVGERGRELAALPVGTRVMSHPDMMKAVSRGTAASSGGAVNMGGVHITIDGANMDDPQTAFERIKPNIHDWMLSSLREARA